MARPGLTKHPKFLAFRRMLSVNKAQALGHLELLWMGPYESGDPFLGDKEAVEDAAEWNPIGDGTKGDRGDLFAAALNCGGPGRAGFIEEDPDRPGFYRLHDLWDHAPDYVYNRAEREAQRRAKGKTLSELRAEAGRKGAEARWHSHDGKNGNAMANAITPAPAPAPALDERTNEGDGKLLTRKDWEDRETEVRKLANDAVGRIWRVDQRDKIRPTDRSLLLKACLLAIASPCRPYGLAWLHDALDSASCVKRTAPLAKPGAYIHKVLKASAEKAGRNFNADLASLEGVVPTESIDPKRRATQ